MSGLYLSSNTAIAASDPEPMTTELGHYFSQCISIQYFLKKEINISSPNHTEVYLSLPYTVIWPPNPEPNLILNS